MADSEEEFDDDLDLEPEQKKFSGKKLVLFVILPVLLLGGVGAGLKFGGFLGSGPESQQAKDEKTVKKLEQTVFFDLPDMLVNLNSTGRRQSFLKMKVSLELTSDTDVPEITKLSPRIIDNFQVYLRELRIDDLRGSAGVYRLREELLARVNASVRPTVVRDVLFKEMLIQ